MRAYAGIGSREITADERKALHKAAEFLRDRGYICYSGNAEGADTAFQEGSQGECVLFLPWEGFNGYEYSYACRGAYVVGDHPEGQASITQYHPSPDALNRGGRALMSRNYFQIMGYDKWPVVDFVVCCATPSREVPHVEGGTGQAVRIAVERGIPVINIRTEGWREQLARALAVGEITEILMRVTAPHFCAGVCIQDDRITDAAPILRWAVGKSVSWFIRYIKQKRWRGVLC